MTQPETAVRPLGCTRCGEPVGIAEDITGYVDWGQAVVDTGGTVRPAKQHMEFYKGDPVRVRAVCHNPDCNHQWTLRRAFEPTAATPPVHLPKGTNAEDCPACKGTNPDYPFLCPGPPAP